MIKATDSDYAPWYKVPADNKRSARPNCISHMLSMISYEEVPFELTELTELTELSERRERKEGVPDSVPFLHTVEQKY
jgi:hypothetical protein